MVLLLLAAALAPSCRAEALFSFEHPAMGTTWSLLLYAWNKADAEQAAGDAFDVVDDAEALLSNYRQDSELSRINREAAREPVTTDPETLAFLETSLGWSARSDSAFDITVGPLMRAWGFFRATRRVPGDAELAQTRDKVGWRKVRLDPAERTQRRC